MSKITNFPITVYGNKEKFSDTITRGRCRVFHTGHNRNGTYITKEFAQKLIESAPYTPVKGIYEAEDFSNHGKSRSEGRIYGIVPAKPNFAWESHIDSDGQTREYACFDVLYYTALYEEASEIPTKGESMELYRKTLKGEWKYIEGKKAYVFSDGCFLGFQVLGDDVEPCFHGASFYEQQDNILAILEKYEKRPDLFQNPDSGGDIMNINFKLSDSQKLDLLFSQLNPNFNEEGNWTVEYGVCEVFEKYAVVVNYSDGTYERVYYIKNDEEDKIEIVNRERCYVVDVNEEEKQALNNIAGEGTFSQALEHKINNESTITSLNEEVENLKVTVNNLTEENQNYSIKIGELEENNSTLTTERDNAQANFETASASLEEVNLVLESERVTYNALSQEHNELLNKYSTLEVEKDTLAAFKKDIVDGQKKAVVTSYSEFLDAEVIQSYLNQIDSYTAEELDMRLTYEQKKANPTIFSKQEGEPQHMYVPKEEPTGRGINDILAHYEKK